MFFTNLAVSALALASTAAAGAWDFKRTGSSHRSCRNTPWTRDCWGNGWDIGCNYDQQWPKTGRVKSYQLHITSGMGGSSNPNAPLDGHDRPMLLVNGQYPGPLIEANWGDELEITVYNDLSVNEVDNATSIHWHGFRQYHTNTQDGTNGITECPIAPGYSRTYRFVANAYGTSWYHSHYSIQYANGIVGPVVIHGPASANYDIDLGPVTLTDWFYTEAFALYELAKVAQGPPLADNILINGKMKGLGGQGGAYWETTFTPGKKHLLRFVNTGINDFMQVKLEGHQFQVISADFVPVKPFYTDSLVLGVGQRYDVIVKANQPVANYWLHVSTGNAGFGGPPPALPPCDGPMKNQGNVKAIIRYKGAPGGDPISTTPPGFVSNCGDLAHPLVPVVKQNVPTGAANEHFEVGFRPANTSVQGQFVTWLVNNEAIDISWETPTLSYVTKNNFNFPANDNVYTIDVAPNTWTYWVLEQAPTNPPIPHPIHLHGHDFWILAQGPGPWDGTFTSLTNPTRRDTAALPAAGHLVVAFPADNPGAWLFHCHIPFHVSGGLGLQFLERPKDILRVNYGIQGFKDQCAIWNQYQKGPNAVTKSDSGL